jgi:hypothetical protein
MSILVTPTLNETETFQVATPFSYSFMYSEPITAVDIPVYYFGEQVYVSDLGSATIGVRSDQDGATATGLVYTVSNMTPVTDVLQCTLPVPTTNFYLKPESYVTFGGPTPLYLSNRPDTPLKFATFEGAGTFEYGLGDSKTDSLKYTVLNGSPVSSFRITLARPNITSCGITCSITANTMDVTAVFAGQVNVGMIFDVQAGVTRAFTVTAFGSARGGTGTYTVAPNDAGAALTTDVISISSTTVAGSGDVVLSNSMTPADGTAQFSIYTTFIYALPGA